MIELLSRDELRNITGVTFPKKQISWLEQRLWPHEVNHFGFPIVLRSVALERLGAAPKSTGWRLDEANVV